MRGIQKRGRQNTIAARMPKMPVHRAEQSERAFSALRSEYKEVFGELIKMTKERDCYRDAYNRLLREGKE